MESERPDDAPRRTWQSLIAEVPEATPVGGLTAAPAPAASRLGRLARKIKRQDQTSAELLAAIEIEVSEPSTRAALETVRRRRSGRAKDFEEKFLTDPPDNRPWLQRRLEGWWLAFPMMAAAFMVLPFRGGDYSLDFPVGISAAAGLLGAARIVAVQSGRTKEEAQSRGELILPALLLLAAPIISGVRILLMDGDLDFGSITTFGIPVQILSAVIVGVVTLRTQTRDTTDDEELDEDDDTEWKRYLAFHGEAETESRAHLHAALTGRDPVVARASRLTVVDAIRVLREREQVDDDEAEWMLREALR